MIPLKPLHQQLFSTSHFSFLRGVRSPFIAAGYLLTNIQCLKLAMIPWLINLLLIIPLSLLLYSTFVFPWLKDFFPDPTNTFYQVLGWIGNVLISLMIALMTLVTAYLAAIIVGAPFHDKIGEYIERQKFCDHPELLAEETTMAQGIRHSLLEAVKRVLLVSPLYIFTLLIGLVPVIGLPTALILNFVVTTTLITLDAFSMPMDRRNRTFGEKIRWAKSNIGFAIGFGLPLFYLPCVFFLLPPLAAVSGTLIFCEWQLEQRQKNGKTNSTQQSNAQKTLE